MATNYKAFALSLERFTDTVLPEQIGHALAAVGLQVLTGVVQKTPVDTGRARANWQATLNTPPTATTDATDPGGGRAIAAGAAVLGQVQPGHTIYIGNNLPYILPLENGHSRQAPNGMVALTLAEVQAQFTGR